VTFDVFSLFSSGVDSLSNCARCEAGGLIARSDSADTTIPHQKPSPG
jgi:hypothetical protein